MRTTLDLPDKLMAEALEVSNHRTKTAAVVAALEDYVRKHRLAGIRQFRGRLDLDIDLDTLRDRQ